MAYSTPRTWVAGEYPTAAMLNQDIRDNENAAFPLGVDGWTSYTPTLTQSATVTKTVNYAKYQRVGRLIVAQLFLTVTGSGTASNAVVIGLPVAAAVSSVPLSHGIGDIYDTSAASVYKGEAICNTAGGGNSVQLRPLNGTSTGVLGSDTFTAGLAAGDQISLSVIYEAAT